LEIAKAHPRKRRRLKFLTQNRRDLYEWLKENGFIEKMNKHHLLFSPGIIIFNYWSWQYY